VLESIGGIARGGFDEGVDSVGYFQSGGLRVECDREVPIELDGDLWGKDRSAEFVYIPGKLTVYAPKDSGIPKWEETLRSLSPWTPNE
jgi:diacylglycerol kinase family enzyme